MPAGMDGYAGAVVFGGTMSANDDGRLSGIRAQEAHQRILEAWLVEGARERDAPGAQTAAEQRDHHARHDAPPDR